MAKKQKRQVRSVSASDPTPMNAAPRASRSSLSSSDFNPDYSYVRSDLKRIAILAGFFIIVLVALSFILR